MKELQPDSNFTILILRILRYFVNNFIFRFDARFYAAGLML